MAVRILVYARSPGHSDVLHGTDSVTSLPDYKPGSLRSVYDFNPSEHPFLVALIKNENYEGINGYLMGQGVDVWYDGSMFDLVIDGHIPVMVEPTIPTVPQLIVPPRRLTRRDVFSSYFINGSVKAIPYVNFDLNETNGNCFIEFAKRHWPRISGKSIDKFFGGEVTLEKVELFCDKYKVNTHLVNLEGKTIMWKDFGKSDNHKHLRALIANNHIYPYSGCTSHKMVCKLNESASNQETVGETVLVNNGVKFSSLGKTVEVETTSDLVNLHMFKNLPINFTYKDCDLKSRALGKPPESDDYGELHYYDVTKCYSSVFYKMIPEDLQIGFFSCFNKWEKYDGSKINNSCYYLLGSDVDLRKYGICRNFMVGLFLNLLIEYGVVSESQVTYELCPSFSRSMGTIREVGEKHLIEAIKKDNPDLDVVTDIDKYEQYKTYRVYNGIMGRTRGQHVKSFENCCEDDVMLLNVPYNGEEITRKVWENLSIDSTRAVKRTTYFKYINLSNVYNFVVDFANAYVFTMYMEVFKIHGVMPVQIKTDGLVYDRVIPELEGDPNWHKEENPKPLKPMDVKLDVYSGEELNGKMFSQLKEIKSVSYHGSPGCGKTTTVKGNHKFDISATFTNQCAANMDTDDVKARTLFSLFRSWSPETWHEALKSMKGKTLWIDEYSQIHTNMWNFIVLACLQYGTKLILSGDFNQIPAIRDHDKEFNDPVLQCLFGEVNKLVKDFRNEADLIELRDFIIENESNVISNKLKEAYTKDWLDCEYHITGTKATREALNDMMLEKKMRKFDLKSENGKSYLDVSIGVPLICVHNRKTENLFNGQKYLVKSRPMVLTPKSTYVLEPLFGSFGEKTVSAEVLAYNFKLGYAFTAHSTQGLTIDKKFCIHDINLMLYHDKRILYTALTRGIGLDKIKFADPKSRYDPPKTKYPRNKLAEEQEESYARFTESLTVFRK